MVSLSDSAAVVTGAASGIGEAIAHELASHGASVVVADVAEDVHAVADDVSEAGGEAIAQVTDISDPEEIDALVDTAVAEFGTIDVLCNNAGVFDESRSVGDTSETQWDHVLDVNLKGVFLLTKAALPHLQEGDGEGVVVNTASIAGKVAGGGGTAYTSSKHGLIGFTKQFANDYGPDVRANAVCPGFIDTGMTDDMIAETPDEVHAIVDGTPAKRYAEPEEVARVVRFLASDDASFMYGTAVDVDGGWLVD